MKLHQSKTGRFLLLSASVLLMQGAYACGDGNGGTTQSYQGTLTDSSGSVGTLQFNLNTDATSNNVGGSLNPSGDDDSINLTGSLGSAGILSASGGGYTFTGAIVNGFMTGTVSGPNSSNGVFTALNSENSITEYCGVFSGDSAGVWSMEVSSNEDVAASSTVLNSTDSVVYTGSISNNLVTLSSINGNDATGTLSGNTIQGTWTSSNSSSGTFTASSDGCD